MDVLTKEEFEMRKDHYGQLIKEGALFIYPTDTIYGIGCDATSDDAVRRLREVKNRYKRPFSVIAPSKRWILDQIKGDKNEQQWISKLPGPYTLIMRLKNSNGIAEETNAGLKTIGVRIPDHWFTSHIAALGIPVVTTSANPMGEDHMTSLETLDPAIRKKISFIIYEGEKRASPSILIDLTQENEKIVER
ncbi:MAG: threonylcarbamoyl-AMP synthase [DPANN group archaeon]|nr:threonylcarbamoyl-AMP synthase [DPANN group archaeon]